MTEAVKLASAQADERRMLVETPRGFLQLATDLVFGEVSNMLAWTVRSWRIVGSGGGGSLSTQQLNLPDTAGACSRKSAESTDNPKCWDWDYSSAGSECN